MNILWTKLQQTYYKTARVFQPFLKHYLHKSSFISILFLLHTESCTRGFTDGIGYSFDVFLTFSDFLELVRIPLLIEDCHNLTNKNDKQTITSRYAGKQEFDHPLTVRVVSKLPVQDQAWSCTGNLLTTGKKSVPVSMFDKSRPSGFPTRNYSI